MARRVLMLMMACAVGAQLGMWEGGVCPEVRSSSSSSSTIHQSHSDSDTDVHFRFLCSLTWRDRLPDRGLFAVTTSTVEDLLRLWARGRDARVTGRRGGNKNPGLLLERMRDTAGHLMRCNASPAQTSPANRRNRAPPLKPT